MRLAEDEFNRVAAETRLSRTSLDAARMVFVDGQKAVDVGQKFDLSPVRMSQISRAIREANDKLHSLVPAPAVAAVEPQPNQYVAAIEASYAVAVKQARDALGDDLSISAASGLTKNIGPVIARTDFHLVQSVGKGQVVVHDMAALDRPPAIGRNVVIQYTAGKGAVQDRAADRPRGGRSI